MEKTLRAALVCRAIPKQKNYCHRMFSISIGLILFCSVAALPAGFIDAIAGGGGLVTIPALMIAGVPPHQTLAVNKASAVVGTTVAMGVFARHGLVLWRAALFGCIFSLFGTWLGTLLALHIDSAILAKILVALLPVGMCATLLPRPEKEPGPRPLNGLRFYLLLPAVCLLIGVYDGFFGPGTGSFLIIVLHWIMKMPLVQASATAKALNLASNFGSALVFLFHDKILWDIALPMIAGGIIGNWLGSRFAIRVGAKAVRRFLSISIGLLLVTLIWRYFIAPA